MRDREVDRWDVLDRVNDGVFAVDADFTYTYLNDAGARLVGRTPEDLVGRSMWVEFPEAKGSVFEIRYREALTEQRMVEFEEYFDPLRAWFRIHVYPSPQGLTIVYSDVTAEHVAQAALAESEERYRLLAENATDVVYRVDQDGRFVWISPSIREALGWDPDEILGRPMLDLLHPDDCQRSGQIRETLLSGKAVAESGASEIVRFRTVDGGFRWTRPRATTLFDGDGKRDGAIVGLRLVDDLVLARQRAQADEELLRVNMDAVQDPLILLEAVRDEQSGTIVDFRYLDVNRATCEYLSVGKEDLLGKDLMTLFPGYIEAGLFDLYVQAAEADEPTAVDGYQYEDEVIGAVRFYDLRAQRVSGGRLSVTWRDVTDRHDAEQRLAESEERYRLLAENTADVVMRTRDDTVVWVSPSLTAALGWKPDEWVGQSLARFGNPEDMSTVIAARKEMDSGRPVRVRIRFGDVNGAWHWVDVHAQAFRATDRSVDGHLSSFRVVDDEVATQAELERLARIDALTGVLNRKEILRKLSGMTAGARRPSEGTAVLFCDVDRFKEINDTYGHSAGDEVLRTLAERIGASIRDEDYVARIGGDELLVVLTAVHGLEAASEVAEKIRDAASMSIEVERARVSTTLSIGVTLLRVGENVDDLVARADEAMYEAKDRGRNQVVSIA